MALARRVRLSDVAKGRVVFLKSLKALKASVKSLKPPLRTSSKHLKFLFRASKYLLKSLKTPLQEVRMALARRVRLSDVAKGRVVLSAGEKVDGMCGTLPPRL